MARLPSEMMDLKNKVVIITGSSSGIGKATALRFVREGAKVVINYSVNKKGGEETLDEIKKEDGKAILIKADVSQEKDVKRLFQRTIKEFGTVDILINNGAAGTDKMPFREADHSEWSKIFEVNLVGTMLCSQYAIKIMEKKGYGKILNTSSIRGAEYGGGRGIAYAVSKAGVINFTKTLAKQVAPKLQVNAVAPGFVKTRSYDTMNKDMVANFINQTYLKRWITVEEIADAFVFLAKNDGITGQVIYVDGGFTLK
ncbi:MAG: SDR family oxidoreductase [Candidatus Micrarchaeota archaeon]|nr:SDR family oxidoreductase [Candidatus Micrarchaeota archaeon]